MSGFRFIKYPVTFRSLFLLFFLCLYNLVKSQYLMPVGARANAMGGATITLPDQFAVFSNPATAPLEEENSIGLFYDHRYSISGLSNMATAGNFRFKNVSVLGGLIKTGDDLLNHSRCEFALAKRIRNVSLGAGTGIHQMAAAENGVARNITFQFGGVAQLAPRISYGASVYNIFRSKVSRERSVYYPVIMRMGISYKPIKPVFMSVEIEKDNRFEMNIKAGIEYNAMKHLFIRTGINTKPSNGYLGTGLKLKEWRFDYGVSFHNRLGFTHYIGLVFNFPVSNSKIVSLVGASDNMQN